MELNFTLDQIREAAKKLLAITAGYKVFAIYGDMGAGKTTLIQALCESMGVRDHVSSPTFSIINQYTTSTGDIIYHIDLYRLKDEQEAIGAGVEDCLLSGNSCWVEWPERALGIFPDDTLYVSIRATDTYTRRIETGKVFGGKENE